MKTLLIAGILLLCSGSVWAQDEASPDTEEGAEATGDTTGAESEEVAEEGSEGETEAAGETEAGDDEEEVDSASDVPEQPTALGEDTLNTRLSGRSRTEMFFTQRARMRRLGDGRYGVSTVNVYPFYETIELRADEIGHKGLSVHFQGWAGLDLADVHFEQRFVADPTYLYLQFRDYGLDIKVGRQMIFSGVTQGLHLDGLHASYETPIHLGIEALGGLVVSPDRGPDWYRDRPGNTTYEDYGGGFSDWERDGDYAVGGRLFYRLAGKASAGASILHVTRLKEIDRQLFGMDLDVTPVKWLGVTGNATMDLLVLRLREANAGLDFYPIKQLTIGVDYRYADPTLYLSHMSIFSVFSTEEYDSVGGSVGVKPVEWLHLDAGYHHHFYGHIEKTVDPEGNTYEPEYETGYDIHAGASAHYGDRHDGLVLLHYRRLGEHDQGLHEIRAGVIVPIAVPGLRATANAYLDLFDEEINESALGFMGDVGLFYGNGELEGGGSFAAGATPYAATELRGMVKFVYNFDISFVERRE